MGIQRQIPKAENQTVNWPQLFDMLQTHGEKAVIRMIDGMPAFPDEQPEANWKEVRIGLSAGMITVKKDSTQLTCVSWGDESLSKTLDLVVEAISKSLATV